MWSAASPRLRFLIVAVTMPITAVLCSIILAGAQQPPPAASFDRLAYSDSGGFAGGGTGIRMTVTSAGEVTVNNRRNGTQKAFRLTDAELARLAAAIQKIDWTGIARTYSTLNAADLVVRDLAIEVHGVMHETHADHMARLPPELNDLFEQLEDLSRR